MGVFRREIWSAVNFFMLVACTALSLSFSMSLFFYQLGLPTDIGTYIRLNLFISGCIALPTAIIASLHDFHMRAYQHKLEEMAWTDSLTGLLNRRFFIHAAEEERARMRRTGAQAAIVLFDLDHFKEVNDLYGHAVGDLVLKEIAAIAHSELRGPFDRLGRWGGEEFIILLSAVNEEYAMLVCERLRARIEGTAIEAAGRDVSVTASFGICMLEPRTQLNAAIEGADKALYQAKEEGRNRLVSAPPPGDPVLQLVSARPLHRSAASATAGDKDGDRPERRRAGAL